MHWWVLEKEEEIVRMMVLSLQEGLIKDIRI